MRIIQLIFTLYLATLSVYPCYDDGCFQDNEVSCADEHQDDDGDNDIDNCTPFCASRCCTFCVTFPIKPALQLQAATQDFNTTYQVRATSLVALPIWQPPRI